VVGIDRGIWVSDLEAVIRGATHAGQPLRIFRVDVSLPVGFFAMTSPQVAVLGTVTGSIVQVA
jgi:hypothetical protein